MLVLSLLFVTVLALLVFSFTKDTGKNTVHARKAAHNYVKSQQTAEQAAVGPVKVAKAS